MIYNANGGRRVFVLFVEKGRDIAELSQKRQYGIP